MKRGFQFCLGAFCALVVIGAALAAVTMVAPPDGVRAPASAATSEGALTAGGAARLALPLETVRHTIANPKFSIEAPAQWSRMSPAALHEAFVEHGDRRFTAQVGFVDDRDDRFGMFIGAAGLRDGEPLKTISALGFSFKLTSWISWLWGKPIAILEPAHALEINGLAAARIVFRHGGRNGAVIAMTIVELDFNRLLVVQVVRGYEAYGDVMRDLVMSIRKG